MAACVRCPDISPECPICPAGQICFLTPQTCLTCAVASCGPSDSVTAATGLPTATTIFLGSSPTALSIPSGLPGTESTTSLSLSGSTLAGFSSGAVTATSLTSSASFTGGMSSSTISTGGSLTALSTVIGALPTTSPTAMSTTTAGTPSPTISSSGGNAVGLDNAFGALVLLILGIFLA